VGGSEASRLRLRLVRRRARRGLLPFPPSLCSLAPPSLRIVFCTHHHHHLPSRTPPPANAAPDKTRRRRAPSCAYGLFSTTPSSHGMPRHCAPRHAASIAGLSPTKKANQSASCCCYPTLLLLFYNSAFAIVDRAMPLLLLNNMHRLHAASSSS
jgi:hypothetical protein